MVLRWFFAAGRGIGFNSRNTILTRCDDGSLQPDEVSGSIPGALCKVQILAHVTLQREPNGFLFVLEETMTSYDDLCILAIVLYWLFRYAEWVYRE